MRAQLLCIVLVQAVFSFSLNLRLSPVVSSLFSNDATSPTEHAEVLFFVDKIWTTTVVIGTPGEAFNVAVDTTSGFLFVSSARCTTCNDTTVFDPTLSSTYHDIKKTYHENTRFGNIQGEIGEDTIVLGGNRSTSVTVTRASFGQTTSTTGTFPPGVDGILGFAFQSTSPPDTQPVFDTAIHEQAVTTGIFTIWLEDQFATSDNGTHGVIYYGNNDPLHCKVNQRHVYPLSSAHYFQFTVVSVTVGTYQWRQRTPAYIDSMSSLILAPAQFVSNVLQQIGLPANLKFPYIVPCNQQITLGFNFNLGTENVTQLNMVLSRTDGTCMLALNTNGQNEFVLGYPFLRGRCTYFDVTNHQIGFSDAKSHGADIRTTAASTVTTSAASTIAGTSTIAGISTATGTSTAAGSSTTAGSPTTVANMTGFPFTSVISFRK